MVFSLIAAALFLTTYLGGLAALRFREQLHLVLGFSAGAVLGVALFDLLPEAFERGGHAPDTVVLFVALGFLAYLLIDRVGALRAREEEPRVAPSALGAGAASALVADSFLDGVAVGAALQVSLAVGAVVAFAILVHDFADGMNTVNLVLRAGGAARRAHRWLLYDAVAPAAGVVATLFIRIPEAALGLILAVFAGAFLYISASDLIPESHRRHPRAFTTAMTLLGAAALFFAARLAG